MHRAQEQVRDFHRARDLARPPYHITNAYTLTMIHRVYYSHLKEEVQELGDALVSGNDICGVLDALCDIIYLAYGTAVSLGIDLEPYFEEVHRANMEKCQAPLDGEGRQTKPVGWIPPDLRAILDRESKRL